MTIYLYYSVLLLQQGIQMPIWFQLIWQIVSFGLILAMASYQHITALSSTDEVTKTFANLPSQQYHVSVIIIIGGLVFSVLPIVLVSADIKLKTFALVCFSIYILLFVADNIRQPDPFS